MFFPVLISQITTHAGPLWKPHYCEVGFQLKYLCFAVFFYSLSQNVFFAVSLSIFNIYYYSQLSRKLPPLVQDKVIAYGRWWLTGKINNISPKLDSLMMLPYQLKLGKYKRSSLVYFFSCCNFREKHNRVYLCLLFDHCNNSCLPQNLIIDIIFVCKLLLYFISPISVINNWTFHTSE